MRVQDIAESVERLRYYIPSGEIPIGELVSQEALPRLRRHPVTVAVRSGLILFNYNNWAQSIPAVYWKPLLRLCRGVIFTEKGELVSLPYHKFFNLNELPEDNIDRIALLEVAAITEKIDGVLVQAAMWKGEQIWASRHNFFTPPTRIARQFWGDAPLPEGFTLLFEVVAPSIRQRTMIRYNEPALWYLGCRSLCDFSLYQGPPPQGVALSRGVRVVPVHIHTDLREFVQYVAARDGTNYEGVVIQFAEEKGNHLVKVKGIDYLQRVRLLRGLTASRILLAYKNEGIEGVVERLPRDVIDDPEITQLIALIQATEEDVIAEVDWVQKQGMRPHDLPEHKRWMASPNPQKYIRPHVVRLVQKKMGAEEDN